MIRFHDSTKNTINKAFFAIVSLLCLICRDILPILGILQAHGQIMNFRKAGSLRYNAALFGVGSNCPALGREYRFI